MAAPDPVDIMVAPREGPSAADVAGRVQSVDPRAQAQVSQARVVSQKQQEQLQRAAIIAAAQANSSASKLVSGFATVKAVPSADILVLVGSGPNAPEKQLTLSGIEAPRLARRKGNETDEPYAWQSKEFLRKRLIGRQVKFAVTSINEKNGREYGSAQFNGEDIVSMIVAAGWASVKLPQRKDGKVPADREALVALEEEAKTAKRGKYQSEKPGLNAVRVVDHVSSKARAFFESNRGKSLNGIVDQVREGSTLRIEIPSSDSRGVPMHSVILLNLAGVQCPRIPLPMSVRNANWERQKLKNPYAEKPKQESPQPFACEAVSFVENRLLNRDVTIQIVGCDKTNNLFGTVHVPQGNISLLLLRNGLAKFVDWSANLSSVKDELYAAEKLAKTENLNIWKSFVAPKDDEELGVNQFMGKVVQVASSDTLIVLNANKKEVRVVFASVRAPRIGYRDRKSEPWAVEGKEWLRKRFIGRRVKVIVEYIRNAGPEARVQEPRKFVTILSGKENVSETFLSLGFGTVMRHRIDEERSQFYDDLLNAESKAILEKKGVHGAKPSSADKELIDLSGRVRVPQGGDPDKAAAATSKQRLLAVKIKQFLPFLQSAKRTKAVVEHVFSGNRLKLVIPSQNCIISFVLAGIRCPWMHGDTPEPFSSDAYDFTRFKVLQHEVEIEVESLDKGDNFVGSLFIDRQNLSVLLLKRGFARAVPFIAERSKYAEEMFTAEKLAQHSRLCIWVDWSEKQEAEAKAERAPRERQPEVPKQPQKLFVKVSEAFDPLNFFVQVIDQKHMLAIESAIAEAILEPTSTSEFDGKKGEICLGKFSDDAWYRVKIQRYADDGYEVIFIDYGNQCFMPYDALRSMPKKNVPILSKPGLARAAVLSGVRLAADYLEECAEAFLGLVFNRRFNASVDAIDNVSGHMHVTLIDADEEDADSVNLALIKCGLVRVPGKPLREVRKLVQSLRPYEQEAKEQRLGLWEYGDVSSDEDEDDSKKKQFRK